MIHYKQSYLIQIGDTQLELLMKCARHFVDSGLLSTLTDDEAEELAAMLDMSADIADAEAANPGNIHGWCI